MKTQSRIWHPSPGGSMRFWNLLERQFSLRLSRMSKRCLSTSEYHLQVHLSHLPFTTHSLKEFYTDLISMDGLAPSLHNFPSTGALVAIDVTSFFLLTFVLVSQENMKYLLSALPCKIVIKIIIGPSSTLHWSTEGG